MEWESRLNTKLMSPAEAVSVIESGNRVAIAPFSTTPFTLCAALYERRHELKNVRVDHPAGLFAWVRPDEPTSFNVRRQLRHAAEPGGCERRRSRLPADRSLARRRDCARALTANWMLSSSPYHRRTSMATVHLARVSGSRGGSRRQRKS